MDIRQHIQEQIARVASGEADAAQASRVLHGAFVPAVEEQQFSPQARDAMALRRGFNSLPPQVQRQLIQAMKKRRTQQRPTLQQQQQMHRMMQQSGMLRGALQY